MSLLPQPVVASDAFVLRTWPTGETSVIASLLTAQYGYVRVIAKSARRPQSTLRPLVQPGRLVSLEFSYVPRRQLQFLRGGSLGLDPLASATRLETSAYLLAVVELVDRCRPTGAGEERLFALCADYVQVLSCAPPGSEASLFYAFELALLEVQGVAPVLDSCSGCGGSLTRNNTSGGWFNAASGGAICSRCATESSESRIRVLTRDVHDTLCSLADHVTGLAVPVKLSSRVAREVGISLHDFLIFHLPGYRLPAALELLRARPHPPGPGQAQRVGEGEGRP